MPKITKSKKKLKKGAGIMDVLKDPIGTFKEAMEPIPTKINNISRRTLEEYGDQEIQALQIRRSPLESHWTNALNNISLGKFDQIQEKNEIDKLFHLSLIFTINNTDIIVEKNEVINIAPYNGKSNMESMPVSLNSDLNLGEMINNTKNFMGAERFYDYDAFGGNNCQNFIMSVLESNGLLTERERNFIFQDLSQIVQDLKEVGQGQVPNAVKKVTKLGSIVSRMIGKGRKEIDPEFIRFVKNNGFRFI